MGTYKYSSMGTSNAVWANTNAVLAHLITVCYEIEESKLPQIFHYCINAIKYSFKKEFKYNFERGCILLYRYEYCMTLSEHK